MGIRALEPASGQGAVSLLVALRTHASVYHDHRTHSLRPLLRPVGARLHLGLPRLAQRSYTIVRFYANRSRGAHRWWDCAANGLGPQGEPLGRAVP